MLRKASIKYRGAVRWPSRSTARCRRCVFKAMMQLVSTSAARLASAGSPGCQREARTLSILDIRGRRIVHHTRQLTSDLLGQVMTGLWAGDGRFTPAIPFNNCRLKRQTTQFRHFERHRAGLGLQLALVVPSSGYPPAPPTADSARRHKSGPPRRPIGRSMSPRRSSAPPRQYGSAAALHQLESHP